MQNFHENKLWQESYVVLMDIHGVVDKLNEVSEMDEDVIEELLAGAQLLAAKIADGLSRLDHRAGRDIIYAAIGQVAVVRTQLAVAWGRGLFDDETFRGLDTKYATLSENVQRFK